ncbi:MAG: hypothetical protein IPK19_18245 [Chloroflexi bacterium]|nr:hypothetical protein [Chloroflexota bacterium]
MKLLRFAGFCVLGLVFGFSHGRAAPVLQGDPMYTACDAPASESLPSTTAKVDFNAGCDKYRQCIAEHGYQERSCLFDAAMTLLESCDLSQTECRQVAFLYAEMIHIFVCYVICDRGQEEQLQALSSPYAGLSAYNEGLYSIALTHFPRQDYTMNEGRLAFARAVVHWSAGDAGAALREMDMALHHLYGDPIIVLVQAELQALVGDTEYAGLLAEQARRLLTEPKFQTLAEPLTTTYPFSDAIWEEWAWYPTGAYSISPGGEYDVDMSREPARAIRIGFSSNRRQMIAEGLLEDECGTAFICVPFIILNGGEDGYSLVMLPDLGDGEQSVFLARNGEAFRGEARTGGFEWRASTSFVIAPASAGDPRVNLPGEWCGVRSRLEVGMTDVSREFLGGEHTFPVFDQAEGSEISQVAFETPLTIVAESVCLNDVTWWPVKSEEIAGWIAENDGNRYLFRP